MVRRSTKVLSLNKRTILGAVYSDLDKVEIVRSSTPWKVYEKTMSFRLGKSILIRAGVKQIWQKQTHRPLAHLTGKKQ